MTSAAPRPITPLQFLAASLGLVALVQLLLWHVIEKGGVSRIFWYLLKTYDTHGNVLVGLIVLAAFALRGRSDALQLVRLAAERPWVAAAIAFPLLCIASLQVYRVHPVSMDEYSSLFQAQVFAAGRLRGELPPDLLDRLVPRSFQGHFFFVSRESGQIAAMYWPSFPLLLAPFVWLGVPWMANPLLAALSLPAIHGLARELTGSREAGGWALLLAAASPVFVINSISLYSMPAHLLCNVWYARLLLAPTPAKCALAGVLGSISLTLHYPFRHALFAAPFLLWVLIQPRRVANLAALAAGYAPLSLLLGLGWQLQIAQLGSAATPGGTLPSAAGSAPAAPPTLAQSSSVLRALSGISLPSLATLEARAAALSKDWTWGAGGLFLLAAAGAASAWKKTAVRVLVAAPAITLAGYLLSPGDQGHGWGHRSLYSAWFAYPVLGAAALLAQPALRQMMAWAVVLSLVLANGLRLVQVQGFVVQHLRQVPPLARAPEPSRPQVVFVNLGRGLYVQDLVQNDPFLRGPRIAMVMGSSASADALMAARFPGYRKVSEGEWGQLWERPGAK